MEYYSIFMSISKSCNFLPSYLQTTPNKRFLGATLDLLINDPQVNRFSGYIGRAIENGQVQSGNYLLENTPIRQNYQLEAAFVTRDNNQNIVNISNFIDVLNSAANKGSITNAWNRLLTSGFYSWKGFNDTDKIINYQNYCWISTSDNDWYWKNSILIHPVNSLEEDILGKEYYTDPYGIQLLNGMIVSTPNNLSSVGSGPWIVEGVGNEIIFVPLSNIITPNFSAIQNNPPDYITINRAALDLNLWSRTNLWVHKNTIENIILYLSQQQIDFAPPTSFVFADRPIIEMCPALLYQSGKIGVPAVTYFDNGTPDALYIIQGQYDFMIDGYHLAQGDSVIFNADKNLSVRQNIYDVNLVDTSRTSQILSLSPVQVVSFYNLPLY